ncbi:MAG: hypothetical protein E7379_04565 [Clostridiales bacterium]|nr:hypothetical protein [Clostridiales bacterium]
MSKRLVKIMLICTVAILLPLAVVAVAITATQAKGVSVAVEETGKDATISGATSEVSIYVKNQKQDETTVSIRKNSKVTVVFTGKGYVFEGWFEGSADEINDQDKAVSKSKSYEFSAKNSTVLTAVRNVQKYNITFSGENADGSTVVLQALNGVEYNTALPILPNSDSKMFAGWTVKDADDVITSFYATFEVETQNADLELVPVWKENASYNVFFSANDRTAGNTWEMVYNIATGFENYPFARQGYTFQGLQIEGKDKVYAYDATANDYICDGENLSDVLVKNPTAVVYAVWDCIFPAMSFAYEVQAYYEDAEFGYSEWMLYTVEGTEKIEAQGDEVRIEVSDKNNIDITDNFMNYFIDENAEYVTYDDKVCKFNGNIRIADDRNSYDIDFRNVELTFENVYTALAVSMGISDYTLLAEKSFTVYFMFDIV